jgi:hypothetical protein
MGRPSSISDNNKQEVRIISIMAPIFYGTATGVVYANPIADEVETTKSRYDSADARERLAERLNEKQQQHAEEQQHTSDTTDSVVENGRSTSDIDRSSTAAHAHHAPILRDDSTELAIRRIEQLQLNGNSNGRHPQQSAAAAAEQQKLNRRLAQFAHKNPNSKAIPSAYVHKVDAADNAAKRAIVHHTGSHYHMAGSKQFQKGVRVKGVISRHSKQGAKMQNARVAAHNKKNAMEDARGFRSEGTSKSKGKTSKKKSATTA